MGRIGLVVPATETNAIVATIEAARRRAGHLPLDDWGAHMGEAETATIASSPQYYQELFADPTIKGALYDTVCHDQRRRGNRTAAGRRTSTSTTTGVDGPRRLAHTARGLDGGLYRELRSLHDWNSCQPAHHPVLQVDVDNDTPFYNVYGGTRRTTPRGGRRAPTTNGIRNPPDLSWRCARRLPARVDPADANIAYGQFQHASCSRSTEERRARGDPAQPEPASRSH
jgi:hypothetical protein